MKMLTHLHVMVKHLWCWHICKGIKEGKKGDEVLPLGAPPSPVRCTAHLAMVERKKLALAPLVCGVHHPWHDGASRGHLHPCDGAPPLFNREEG
jgi:hypothetical protein